MGMRRVSVGCEFTYSADINTPAIFQVQPRQSSAFSVRSESWTSIPAMPLRGYTDLYGNACTRVVLPAGMSTFRYEAEIDLPDAVEDADESARESAPDDLPDEALIYTLPSRYCLPDVLGNEAWELFGDLPHGYTRVSAICAHVNAHVTFRYGSTSALSTAADVNSSRRR